MGDDKRSTTATSLGGSVAQADWLGRKVRNCAIFARWTEWKRTKYRWPPPSRSRTEPKYKLFEHDRLNKLLAGVQTNV